MSLYKYTYICRAMFIALIHFEGFCNFGHDNDEAVQSAPPKGQGRLVPGEATSILRPEVWAGQAISGRYKRRVQDRLLVPTYLCNYCI